MKKIADNHQKKLHPWATFFIPTPINTTKPLKISDFVNVYYKSFSVCFY